MASANPSQSSDLRIVLLGKNRAEISAIGNRILGRKAFKEKRRVSEVQRGRVEDRNISVIDTPGFFNTELTDEDLQNEMMKSLSLSHPGPHVFLLTVNPDTFTEDDVRKIVKKIEKNFGAHVLKFTLLLFIREQMTNREWMVLKLSKIYQDLISHFRGKYHEINSLSDTTEITTLVEKLDEVVRQNDDQHYSNEKYAMFPAVRNQEQREKVLVVKTNQRISSHEYKDFGATSKLETRVHSTQGRGTAQNIGPCAKAMFGAPPSYKSNIRTGTAEKNATSNTILGNNLCKEEMSSDVSHHNAEHHTFEMCRELFRNSVEEEEKEKERKRERERDKLRRTEEQRSREKAQRIQEEELRNREEEQREKEEIENLKLINAEMRMIELVRTMSMRRRAEVLAALMAARHTKDQDKNRKQFTFESDKTYQNL
ncbi:GTPase IMAP family member 5-like [Triplophysa dalaica]|uniref:GTPase IMAP family member 5-like n=1 Tax=Triplophysa dalaica TaxID=1582913 RepID=UPI0024DFE006|nr:GTPase IMAP family member 5-like [Triplophysa dalaica]